jgi:hypothetical protein
LTTIARVELIRAAKEAGASHKDSVFMAKKVPAERIATEDHHLIVTSTCVIAGTRHRDILANTGLFEYVSPSTLKYDIETYKRGRHRGRTEDREFFLSQLQQAARTVYDGLERLVNQDRREKASRMIADGAEILYGSHWEEMPQVEVDDEQTRYVNIRYLYDTLAGQLEKLACDNWDELLDAWEWAQFGDVEPTLENRIKRINEIIDELDDILEKLPQDKAE